jgi:methionyl-tRNA synthetase
VRELNRFVEDRAPWTAAKDPARSAELDATLYTLCDGIRVLAVTLASVMPQSARRMLEAVGAGAEIGWAETAPGRLAAGAATHAGGPLFPRVDEPLA